MRYFLLCILAAFAFAGIASADDVITLQLETPGLEQPTPKPEPQRNATTVTNVTAQRSERKLVGRVGLVSADRAAIYARQSTKSRVYSVCSKDTALAIVADSGRWLGVLMIDGSTGWIQSSKVRLLNYGAVATTIPANRGEYTSRGGAESRDSGSPIVQTALQYLGVPYVYGGNSPSSGIDCSAFVRMVYAQYGINLPRVARDQANVGTPIAWDDIQPGDRLYFACKHSYVDHCGIYMGNGYFIHASASRGGVAVDSLSSKFYSRSLVAIMR